jgi:hypothetical protein
MPPPNATPPSGRALVLHPTTIPKIAKDLTDEAIAAGKLVKNGVNDWTSAGGLRYVGTDPAGRNRIEHITGHLTVDASKTTQSIFTVPANKLLALIDEAWIKRGGMQGIVRKNGNVEYSIDTGRVIGTRGETTMLIVIKNGTNQVITAFPKL